MRAKPWGSGDSVRRKELHLLRRAIRERWPIPEGLRPLVMAQLVLDAVNHPDARARIAAARALIAADKLNIDYLRLELDADLAARIQALEEELAELYGAGGHSQAPGTAGAEGGGQPQGPA